MRRKLFALLMAAVLCLLVPMQGLGESNPEANIQQVLTQQGELWLTFNTSMDSHLTIESISILMNNQPMDKREFGRLENSPLGTSYVFLVDNAASLPANSLTQAKHVVARLLRLLPAGSNFAMMTVAEAADRHLFAMSTDRQGLVDELDQLKPRTKKDVEKSLYQAVANAQDLMDNAEGINARRVLVVLSDGKEDATDGLTTSELAEKLDEAQMIIHTVALMKKNHDDMTSVQEMGSWSRKTGGMQLSIEAGKAVTSGKAVVSFGDKVNLKAHTTQKADELAAAENNLLAASFAVPASLKGELDKPCMIQMRISYNGRPLYYPKNGLPLSESICKQLKTGSTAVVTSKPQATQVPQVTNVPQTQPAVTDVAPSQPAVIEVLEPEILPENQPELIEGGEEEIIEGQEGFAGFMAGVTDFLTAPAWLGQPMWVFVAAGGAIVILLLVLIIVLARGKKKEDVPPPMPTVMNPPMGEMDGTMSLEGATEPLMGDGSKTEAVGMGGACCLILTETGVPSPKQFQFMTSQNQVILGRSENRAQWVIPGNGSISGRHCQIDIMGGRLFVQDLGSTNGTKVNGQPITGPVEVQQDTVIALGRMSYRINWVEE